MSARPSRNPLLVSGPGCPGGGRLRGCIAASTLAALAVVLQFPAGSVSAEEPGLFAQQLDAENVGRLRGGGPDAIAGIGDWALGNGVVCAALADPDHESMLSDRGGVLVDLGHCGRSDDQWGVLQPMLNLSRDEVIRVESIRAQVTADEAQIVTVGHLHGTRVETTYAVKPAPAAALSIRTTLERESEGEATFVIADVAIHGNGQLAPFTGNASGEGGALGFEHPSVEIDNVFSASKAIVRADLHVLLGTRGLKPEIAYGWRLLDVHIERSDGRVEPLAHVAMNGEHFSILGAYTDTLLWGGEGPPGILEFAQLLWMDLDPGDRVVFVREIMLAKTATVAAITDLLWAGGTQVRGRVDAPFATLHIRRADLSPITQLEADANGRFAFRLPPGAAGPHEIEVLPRAGGRKTLLFDVAKGLARPPPDIVLEPVKIPPQGSLELPGGEIMRLTVVGLDGTPNPQFRADRRGFRVGGRRILGHTESNHYSLVGIPDDPKRIELAPGRYRVLASRGPLWSVSAREFSVAPGQTVPLGLEPPVRLLDHPGWLSADLHVHAAPSEDSGLPLGQRIADFVAMGAQVIVSTEHDNVFDYAPVIEAMGLSDQLRSLVGVEITSTYRGPETPHTAGHSNAFPVEWQRDAYRGGAPTSQNRRLARIAEDVRALPGRPILQLNHPREGSVDSGLGSYFSHLSVVGEPHDPTLPLDAPGNRALIERKRPGGLRDLDFDAVELLNGKSMARYRVARADWFAFLLQGEIRTATANSDSHNARETVALPVNYVAYGPDPEGSALETERFMESIRRGRLYGSTGPLLDVRLGDRSLGERFAGRAGTLRVQVRAAPWVPVNDVRVFINGQLEDRRPLPAAGLLQIPLRFEADAFVTVEVEGSADPDSLYGQVAPGYTPFAFTNPIFVDADGDGRWTPPGLPAEPTAALNDPLGSP